MSAASTFAVSRYHDTCASGGFGPARGWSWSVGDHRHAAPAGAGDQQRPGILRGDGDALGAGEQRGGHQRRRAGDGDGRRRDDTLTYSLEGTDAASFTIDSGTGQIKTKSGVTYNHEATKNSYTVTVKADDGNDATDTIAVTISVTDVAEQPSKPAAPTVSAVSGSATSLTASWSAPGLNGGPALTGYEVQYRAGSGTWTDFGHTGTAVTTTITGLMADTSYQVRVRALNGETPSDWSDPSAAVKTNDLPELSVADVSAQEGNSLTFTVTLSPASAATVTVRWAASSLVAGNDAVAGTDYTAASGTLTFGANETSKQVTVATREDMTDEEDETFTLTLSSPTNAALSNGRTELEVTGTIENDDTPPTISIAADVRVLENVESVSLTVNLSAASGKDVRFRWRRVARSGDTAAAADLREASAVEGRDVVIDAGATSSTPTARSYIVNDALNEDDETFTLEIHAFQNATAGSKTEATVTIRNDDALPRITIGRVTPDPNEGDGVVVVPLTLNEASGREVSAIWYANRSGYTAEAADFADDLSLSVDRKIVFSAGSVSEQIRINLVDDTIDEDDETFQVILAQPSNATLNNSNVTVTIIDDDAPPTITIAGDVSQSESIRGLELTINLSEASEKLVRFKISRVDRPGDTATVPEDLDSPNTENQFFVMSPGTTTVNRGWNYIRQDTLDEPDETFTLQIHTFENATAGAKTEATVTIEDDDDPPVVSVAAARATEGDPVEFTISLSPASGKTVMVRATASAASGDTATAGAGGDFIPFQNALHTFAPGETSKTRPQATIEDTLDEPDETFTVTLSGPTNATLSTTNATAKGTIVDDDSAPVVTLVLTPSSISEAGGSTAVTATLSNPSSEATRVTVSAAPVSPAVAGDFALSSNRTLTIAAGATTSTGTVTIAANDNDVDAEPRQVMVSATATNTQPVAGNPDNVILTITDNEVTPTVTLALSSSSISENGGTTVATASLSGPSIKATTVTLTAAPGDWTADGGGRLTIQAGATGSDGSVTLTAVNDDMDAPDKALMVTATAANTQGVNQPAGVALAITDDEAAPTPTLSLSSDTIGEDGGTATVSVQLDHASSEATTVTVTAAGADPKAAQFTLTGAVLTVPAGLTQGLSTATIAAVDNEVDAPDQTVGVAATADNVHDVQKPGEVTLTIEDDEASPTVTLILSADAIGEAGETATVTAALSHPSSEATTVAVRAEAVSPAEAGDFTLSGSVLTIAAGSTSSTGTVTVTAVPNDVDAPDRLVTVSAAADNKQGFADHPAAVPLTITDDDERGLVFSPKTLTLPEQQEAPNAYTVALTSEPTEDVTLTVTSQDRNRLLMSDYTATETRTFTPLNWDTAQAITLNPVPDNDTVENTVQLRHAATGGDYGSVREDYAVTILDANQDSKNIRLLVNPSEVPEGGGAQSLRVTAQLDGGALTSPATVSVTVGAGTAEAADFTASLTPTFDLTIAADAFNASRTVTLTPVDDDRVEGPETVRVTGTTTATQQDSTIVLGVSGAEVTIRDDDVLGVTVAADDSLEVDEDGSATYTVVLDSEPVGGDVTVTPAVTGNTDVTVSPVLTFTALTWAAAQTVTVSAAADDDAADDTATVTHAVAGADYDGVTAASVSVSVEDDDELRVTVMTAADPLAVAEDGSAVYTVVLTAAPSGTVTVTPTVTGNTDVTVSPSSLGFTSDNWDEAQEVTVSAAADPDAADDTATVTHAVTGAAGLTARDVMVTVTDNDDASTTVTLSVTPETVSESGTYTVTVTAALDKAALTTDTDVTVRVEGGTGPDVASTTDFAADPAVLTLTIDAGDTEAQKTFRLTPVEDELDEGDGETVQVTGTTTATQEGSATLLEVTPAGLTIEDDDARGVTVEAEDPLEVAENGSATYTVVLDSKPVDEDVTVTPSLATDSDKDVTVMPAVLTFTADNWDAAQEVTVSAAHDDDTVDDEATVTHAVAGADYGSNRVTALPRCR